MTRRKIMRSMLITLGIALPGLLGRAATASAGALSRNLKELLGDIDSARAIGECHLAERPTETDFRHIISMLAADGFMIDTPIDQPRLVCRQLRARIRQDFAEGRIVVVDSWHMSATEVRLCTLAALETRYATGAL